MIEAAYTGMAVVIAASWAIHWTGGMPMRWRIATTIMAGAAWPAVLAYLLIWSMADDDSAYGPDSHDEQDEGNGATVIVVVIACAVLTVAFVLYTLIKL
jgi:hypothetical protein